MQDDQLGALRAWNQIDKPYLNAVKIDGLHHARYETIVQALGIEPNVLLTADAFERARRRLDELPDSTMARLTVSPERDGFATADVAIAERPAFPRSTIDLIAIGLHAAIDREIRVTVPGFTGGGDTWSATWRFWQNRPAGQIAYTTPHVGILPGIWRVDAVWQADTYALPDVPGSPAPIARETRSLGTLTMSDWLTGSTRYSITTGFDSWTGLTKAVTLGGSIERLLRREKIGLIAEAGAWRSVNGGPSFASANVRARWRSSNGTEGWTFRGEGGAGRVSDTSPLGLWLGAGDGHASQTLLRAHPLLDDGIIDATGASVFGRSLAGVSAEAVRWLPRPAAMRLGLAGFLDAARAWRQVMPEPTDTPTQYDIGVGLRMRIPGVSGLLRMDMAHGLRDGANAFTVGFIE
jgi:hypothetical protein